MQKAIENKGLTQKGHDVKLLVLNDLRSSNGGLMPSSRTTQMNSLGIGLSLAYL